MTKSLDAMATMATTAAAAVAYEEHDRQTLSFEGLVAHLSRGHNMPTSMHLRSMLLAPFTSSWYAQQADELDATRRAKYGDDLDQWRWDVVEAYRQQVQVAVVGRRVPSEVLRTADGKEQREKEEEREQEAEEEPYAVIMVGYMGPGGATHSDILRVNPERWGRPMLSLWLSSQTQDSDGTAPLSFATKALLDHLLLEYIPRAMQRLTGSTSAAAAPNFLVGLGAVHTPAVRYWREKGAVEYIHDYVHFLRQDQRQLVPLPVDKQDEDWHEATIQSDSDVRLVQGINKISYPTWYIDARRDRSIILRDAFTPGGEEKQGTDAEYARERARGAAAGWAFVHEDMTLGSLHVAPAYRRFLRSSQPSQADPTKEAKKKSVGHVCVDRIEPMVLEAQRTSFERAGLSPQLPTEYFLATEAEDNEAALRFFNKVGFVPFMHTSWGTINVSPATS